MYLIVQADLLGILVTTLRSRLCIDLVCSGKSITFESGRGGGMGILIQKILARKKNRHRGVLKFNFNFTVYFFIFISTFYMLPQSEGASSHFLNVNSWKIFDAKKKLGGGAGLPPLTWRYVPNCDRSFDDCLRYICQNVDFPKLEYGVWIGPI